MSQLVNENNINNVRRQIKIQKQSHPFHTTVNYPESVITDYDHFPYRRWFRGQTLSDKPIIAEREAGYRPVRKNCYASFDEVKEPNYPNHCFEGSCSLVVPCYPQYLQKFSDRDHMNVILNKACIVQYR